MPSGTSSDFTTPTQCCVSRRQTRSGRDSLKKCLSFWKGLRSSGKTPKGNCELSIPLYTKKIKKPKRYFPIRGSWLSVKEKFKCSSSGSFYSDWLFNKEWVTRKKPKLTQIHPCFKEKEQFLLGMSGGSQTNSSCDESINSDGVCSWPVSGSQMTVLHCPLVHDTPESKQSLLLQKSSTVEKSENSNTGRETKEQMNCECGVKVLSGKNPKRVSPIIIEDGESTENENTATTTGASVTEEEIDYSVSTVDIEEDLRDESSDSDSSEDDSDEAVTNKKDDAAASKIEVKVDNVPKTAFRSTKIYKDTKGPNVRMSKSSTLPASSNSMNMIHNFFTFHEIHRCKSIDLDNHSVDVFSGGESASIMKKVTKTDSNPNISLNYRDTWQSEPLVPGARDKKMAALEGPSPPWKTDHHISMEVTLGSTNLALVAVNGMQQENVKAESATTEKQLPRFPAYDTQKLSDKVWKRITENNRLISRMADRPTLLPGGLIAYAMQDNEFIRLGSGTYGDVYLGKLSPFGHHVAIKLYLKKVSSYGSLFTEASTLQRLNQSGVTPHFYGIVGLEESETYLTYASITDYVGPVETFKPEDLRTLIKQQKKLPEEERMPMKEWYKILRDYIAAIHKVHKCGIVINDVKMDNTLVEKHKHGYRVFLIDFGISSLAVGGREFSFAIENNDTDAFLKEYTQIAPELVYKKRSQPESDLYGLGAILLSLSYKLNDKLFRRLGRLCRAQDPSDRPSARAMIHTLNLWMERCDADKNNQLNEELKLPTREILARNEA